MKSYSYRLGETFIDLILSRNVMSVNSEFNVTWFDSYWTYRFRSVRWPIRNPGRLSLITQKRLSLVRFSAFEPNLKPLFELFWLCQNTVHYHLQIQERETTQITLKCQTNMWQTKNYEHLSVSVYFLNCIFTVIWCEGPDSSLTVSCASLCRFVSRAFDWCHASWAGSGVRLHKRSQVCTEIQVSEPRCWGLLCDNNRLDVCYRAYYTENNYIFIYIYKTLI